VAEEPHFPGKPAAGTTVPASTSRFGLKIEVDIHKKERAWHLVVMLLVAHRLWPRRS
jgi:hypothetical protein